MSWPEWVDEMNFVVAEGLMKYERRTHYRKNPDGSWAWNWEWVGGYWKQVPIAYTTSVMTYLYACMENAIISRLRKLRFAVELLDDESAAEEISDGRALTDVLDAIRSTQD